MLDQGCTIRTGIQKGFRLWWKFTLEVQWHSRLPNNGAARQCAKGACRSYTQEPASGLFRNSISVTRATDLSCQSLERLKARPRAEVAALPMLQSKHAAQKVRANSQASSAMSAQSSSSLELELATNFLEDPSTVGPMAPVEAFKASMRARSWRRSRRTLW